MKDNFDGEISILILNEKYRGIGKKILLEVFNLAKKDNVKNLRILTDESCNYNIYEKLGCEKVFETILIFMCFKNLCICKKMLKKEFLYDRISNKVA